MHGGLRVAGGQAAGREEIPWEPSPDRLEGLIARHGTLVDRMTESSEDGEAVRELALQIAAEKLPTWRVDAFKLWMAGLNECEIARALVSPRTGKPASRATVRAALHDREREGRVERGAITIVVGHLKERIEELHMAKQKAEATPTKAIIATWFKDARGGDVASQALLLVLNLICDARGEVHINAVLAAFPKDQLGHALERLRYRGAIRSDGITVRVLNPQPLA